jgi:hypothetical protein
MAAAAFEKRMPLVGNPVGMHDASCAAVRTADLYLVRKHREVLASVYMSISVAHGG